MTVFQNPTEFVFNNSKQYCPKVSKNLNPYGRSMWREKEKFSVCIYILIFVYTEFSRKTSKIQLQNLIDLITCLYDNRNAPKLTFF